MADEIHDDEQVPPGPDGAAAEFRRMVEERFGPDLVIHSLPSRFFDEEKRQYDEAWMNHVEEMREHYRRG